MSGNNYNEQLKNIEQRENAMRDEKKELKKTQAAELRKRYPKVYGAKMYPSGEKANFGYGSHIATYCRTAEEAQWTANTYSNKDWSGGVTVEDSSNVSDEDMLNLGKVPDRYMDD